MTGRQTLKTKHLAGNPYIALAYLDLAGGFKPVYADCRADWVDELNEKQRVIDLFASTPPLGYDLGLNADHPDYGLLKLIPYRFELGDWYGEKKVWQVSQS